MNTNIIEKYYTEPESFLLLNQLENSSIFQRVFTVECILAQWNRIKREELNIHPQHNEIKFALKEAIPNLFSTAALELYWREVLEMDNLELSKIVANLIKLNSSVCNFFQGVQFDCQIHNHFITTIHKSLVKALYERKGESSPETLCIYTSQINSSLLNHLLLHLQDCPSQLIPMVDWMSSDDALKCISKVITKPKNSLSDKTVILFMRKACKDCCLEVIRDIAMRYDLTEAVVDEILLMVPENVIPLALATVASKWCDRATMHNTSAVRFQITTILVNLLRLLKDKYSLQHEDQYLETTEVLLSNFISIYLDSYDDKIRLCGFEVAEAYANLSDIKLFFQEASYLRQKYKIAFSPIVEQCELKKQDVGDASALPPLACIEDEYCSYEYVDGSAYHHEELEIKSNLHIDSLRCCHEFLSLPETEAEAHNKHYLAVLRIPHIVSLAPADLSDYASSLTLQLLSLNYPSSIENFEELRFNAAKSIAIQFPFQCIPALTNLLSVDEVSLGIQKLSISWLRRIAHALVDKSDPVTTAKYSEFNNILPAKRKNSVPIDAKTLSNDSLKRRSVFQEISDLFFYPLFQIIASHSKSPAIPRKPLNSQDFNTIEDILSDCDKIAGDSMKVEGSLWCKQRSTCSFDSLIPMEGLIAVADILKLCHCSRKLMNYIQQVLILSSKLRNADNVGLRRAALCAAYVAVDKYRYLLSVAGPPPNSSILQTLTRVSTEISISSQQDLSVTLISEPMIRDLVEWSLSTLDNDPDYVGRDIKKAIVKNVLEG